MSREILFKAKTTSKESGEFNNMWVYGDLIHSGGKYYIHPKGNLVSVTGELGKIIVMHEVIPETICQYTGLTDKNGNKIWENDVVKKHFYTDCDAYANSEEYVGVVKFSDCAWVIDTVRGKYICTRPIFEAMAYSEDVKHFEVLGNIFDNPELLEGGVE